MLEAEDDFIQAEIMAERLAIEAEVLAEIGTPILGFTDTEAVKIDFDNRSFKNTKYWANRALKKFRLNGYIILKSSNNHYHVVFDRKVSWANNLCMVGWVAICSNNKEMLTYLAMQCVKGNSTIRLGRKDDKPAPRIVYRYGNQEQQIKEFLKYRKLIKRIIS